MLVERSSFIGNAASVRLARLTEPCDAASHSMQWRAHLHNVPASASAVLVSHAGAGVGTRPVAQYSVRAVSR